MGKKVTVLITSLVMIFNLIASAFISVGNIYAETKSDFINTMEVNGEKVEDLSEIVELREGDKVLLELLHSSDYDGNISINLPKLFKNVDLEYNNDHFNDISIEDDIINLNNVSDLDEESLIRITSTVAHFDEEIIDDIVVNIGQAISIINVSMKLNTENTHDTEDKLNQSQLMVSNQNLSNQNNESSYQAINVVDSNKKITSKYESQNNFKITSGGKDYSSLAFDFHIFSKEAEINAHTNGNIATDTFKGNGQGFGTNQQTNYLKKREDNYFSTEVSGVGNIKISQVGNESGRIVLGSSIPVNLINGGQIEIGNFGTRLDQTAAKSTYKETIYSEKYIDIDNELNNLKDISKILSYRPTSQNVKLSEVNGENQTITGLSSGVNNYLNIKAGDISGTAKRVLKIQLPEKTTLIINVDMNGANINALSHLVVEVNGKGNEEGIVHSESGLLWNLYDSSREVDHQFITNDYAVVGISDYFMGTILAPSAQIKYGALNGSVIAQKTQQNGQESHRWDFTGHEDDQYEDKQVGVSLEGTKELIGKDLTKGMFKFQVLDESGKEVSTGTNDENGKIEFSKINYKKAGNHEYTVKEVAGNEPGMSYDTTEYKVTVKVEDVNGELKAEVSYQNGKPEFTNEYSAKVTSVNLEGHKILTGKDLEKGMFKFQVLDKDGKEVSTGTNDENGKITFEKINYTEEGTYQYTVKEVTGNEPGISYDDTKYQVTVEVEDNDGKLEATVSYPEGELEFTNRYTSSVQPNNNQNSGGNIGLISPITGDKGILGFLSLGVISASILFALDTRMKYKK